ncbi:hypothetical protein FHG87_006711 [Trinorchestia longiramus]|nr:hypothetical protein FHG87_006711 [Trinorchestia longiramus]
MAASVSVCKVGLHWENPKSPRVYSQAPLVTKGFQKEKRAARNFNKQFSSSTSSARIQSLSSSSSSTSSSSSIIQQSSSSSSSNDSEHLTLSCDLSCHCLQKPSSNRSIQRGFMTTTTSVRGLPYDESQSVYNQPLASRLTGTGGRGSSLPKNPGQTGRASSLSRDPVTETSSYGSRHPRRSSLFDEDDFPSRQSFKKFSLGSTDPERVKDQVSRDRMHKAVNDFLKTPISGRSREYETSEVKFREEIGPRGQPVIKREQYTYTLPETASTMRKSSITESSSYDSKPPLSLRTRRSSIGSGEEFSRTSVRTRKYSEDTNYGLPPRPSRFNRGEDSSSFASARQVRDARRAMESDELTENIMKMVNKMKSHHLDDAAADIRSISRTIRATSLDPVEDDSYRSRSKQRARLHNFTYGIGK